MAVSDIFSRVSHPLFTQSYLSLRDNKELMHVILENIGYASDIMLYSGDGGLGPVYKHRQIKDQRNEMLHKVYYGFDSGDTDTILAIVWCKNTIFFFPSILAFL